MQAVLADFCRQGNARPTTRCYGVQHGATVTCFHGRWEAALAYWAVTVGAVLVYRAKGRWGGVGPERSTRWLRVSL